MSVPFTSPGGEGPVWRPFPARASDYIPFTVVTSWACCPAWPAWPVPASVADQVAASSASSFRKSPRPDSVNLRTPWVVAAFSLWEGASRGDGWSRPCRCGLGKGWLADARTNRHTSVSPLDAAQGSGRRHVSPVPASPLASQTSPRRAGSPCCLRQGRTSTPGPPEGRRIAYRVPFFARESTACSITSMVPIAGAFPGPDLHLQKGRGTFSMICLAGYP